MLRRSLLSLALAGLITVPATAATVSPLDAAISAPVRSAENVKRDGARHPAETLKAWGIKPGQTVIEISPGTGYWTEILAPYAKATGGHYLAGVADLSNPKLSEGARKGRADFEARFADTKIYGEVGYLNFGPVSGPLGAPGSADVVITARNIHNWLWSPGLLDKAFSDFHAALKPGGVLAVEEHRADPRPQIGDARDGYVAEATVIAAAQKAGFTLLSRSEVNANPKDTKDHPFGVWTLPPVRRSANPGTPVDPAFDRARYDAIGESDRMTLTFRRNP